MKPFTAKLRMSEAWFWLSRNAHGQCSILVDTNLGCLEYVYSPWIDNLFKRLNGPIKEVHT